MKELLAIGADIQDRSYAASGFLARSFPDGKHPRARAIGQMLHDQGGTELMLEAHAKVQEVLGRLPGSDLEACWNRVGDWLS